MRISCILAITALCVYRVAAHSWVHCTEASTSLSIVKNSDYTDAACTGFPRNFYNYAQWNSIFGGDAGFNYQPDPANNDPICRDEFTSSSYTTKYPMATYSPGQQVRVIWPAKNHQADPVCTNIYIPDASLKLYMDCSLTGTRKPTVNSFLSSATMVIDWKANGGKGFQNCPDFCSNTGLAVCYEDFTVPSTVPVGSTCTFVWVWFFNLGDTKPYTSCWEASITGGSGGSTTPAPTNAITPAPTSVTTPAPTKTPTSATTPAPTSPTTTPAPTKTPTSATTPSPTSSSGTCSTVWRQCGGIGYTGSTCCSTGNKCVYLSNWYSQCWPNSYNGKPESLSAETMDSHFSQTGTSTLVLVFVGSAVGTAVVILSAGVAVIYIRRKRAIASTSTAAEVFIPMQSVE